MWELFGCLKGVWTACWEVWRRLRAYEGSDGTCRVATGGSSGYRYSNVAYHSGSTITRGIELTEAFGASLDLEELPRMDF